jgi:hypothetical protein
MKEAQVSLEDTTWSVLQAIASREGREVSDLIRVAVEEKYLSDAKERVEAFRAWKSPWQDRDDLGDSSEYIERLRQDDRMERIYAR